MKSGATESSFYYLSQYYQFPNNVEVSRSIEILSQSNKQYKILWAHDNCDQPQLARLPELVSQIDLIVCVSKWEKEQYVKYNRAPEEKIAVIPNGVADIFNLKTPKSKTAIYFSGPHKGIAPLPKIWKQVIKNHPDAKLKVFSSHNLYGEQYEQHFKIPEHLEAIQELKSLPGVEYSPCVDREDLLPHIQDAAFFVHPNVWEETFCVSMAEAMVCGCYPITSDIGALSEISFNRGKYIPMLGTNTPVGWEPSPKFINEFAQELSRCFEFFDEQPETFYTATKELSQISKETYDWKKIATYWEQLINTITDQTDHEVSPNDDKLNVKTEVTNNSEEYLSWFSSVNCLHPRHIGYLYKLKYKDDIEPKVVYDIGANCLHWYNQAKECWDNAEYYLMDGTKHFEFLYKRSGRKYSTDVLSDVDGKNVTYYENIQMSGGNSYYELNYKDFPENTIPFKNQHYIETQRITRSLDSIVRENNWKKPDLIKMDVQGAELDILRGAKETLKTCDHLILELQTKEFMKGAPMLQEVVEYLKTFGYELESNICISPVQGVDGDYHFVKKKVVRRPRYYCMVNMRCSEKYTHLALDTFFRNSIFNEQDKFFLIDNDRSFTKDYKNVTVISNSSPKSFAENMNSILKRAIMDGTDFVGLNNDIAFTKNWNQNLGDSDSISIPLCNQHVQIGGIRPQMELEELTGKENVLNDIANYITTNKQDIAPNLIKAFYCFYVPYEVSSKVGLLDEEFGMGGGEDIDYSLRAEQLGMQTKFNHSSYLLHFSSKTLDSETENQRDQRIEQLYFHFHNKWGKDTADRRLSLAVTQRYAV